MTALHVLRQALDAGMDIHADGEALRIRGDQAQLPHWVERLRPHKAELLALLRQTDGNTLAEASPQAWWAVRDAYYNHHHACPVCIAAGKGYGLRCGAGASLWAAYQGAPFWP